MSFSMNYLSYLPKTPLLIPSPQFLNSLHFLLITFPFFPSTQSPPTNDPPTTTLSNPITPTLPSTSIPTSLPSGNIYPMQTRGKSGIHKPKVFIASKKLISVLEALQHEPSIQATHDEFFALDRNQTWSLVPLPLDRQTIGCKWVFKLDENPDGTITNIRLNLWLRGFTKFLALISPRLLVLWSSPQQFESL